jgi:hypothetical protein
MRKSRIRGLGHNVAPAGVAGKFPLFPIILVIAITINVT